MPRLRGMGVSPYHFCGICGVRSRLSEMSWQRGALVNTYHSGCWDNGVALNERDARIAQIVANPNEELQPHPKLTQPTSPAEEEVSFSI